MSTRQQRARKRQRAARRGNSRAIGYIVAAVLVISILAILGTVGRLDQQDAERGAITDLQGQMSVVCHAGGANCQELINQVQAGGQYEVIEQNGYYWAEAK